MSLVGTILFSITTALLAGGAASAQEQRCSIKVTEPAPEGAEVATNGTVRGTASIPPGHHLWILLHREDFEDVWYPQGEGKIDPKEGSWKVAVHYGEKQDIGWDFEIAATVVNETEHVRLRNYRLESMKSKEWKPIEMPPAACAPVYRRVKKVSHQ